MIVTEWKVVLRLSEVWYRDSKYYRMVGVHKQQPMVRNLKSIVFLEWMKKTKAYCL